MPVPRGTWFRVIAANWVEPTTLAQNRGKHIAVGEQGSLIHLVGDLHQPLHIGRAEDRGGNDIQVQWFGRGSNLHRVWDSNLIDDYGMSYTELANSLPRWSRAKIRQMQQGSIYEWVAEIHQVTNRVYDSAEVGEKLGYRYRYDWWDTVEEQLLTGGVRLAAVLNEIYG